MKNLVSKTCSCCFFHVNLSYITLRSNSYCSQAFNRIAVQKYFSEFIGKHLRWTLFSDVADCATLVKLNHGFFVVIFDKFFKTALIQNIPRVLLSKHLLVHSQQ